MRLASFATLLATLLVLAPSATGGDKDTGVNDEGFVTRWLVLAPIPLGDGVSGLKALAREYVKDEAKLQPKEGEKAKAGDKELDWKAHNAKDYFLDLNAFCGAQTEDSVGYAVCYIHAPLEMKDIRLRIGCDDQAKVYLNGKEALIQENPRRVEKDQNSATVTLQRGVNVLACKIINEKGDWGFCARFVDQEGTPIKNLRVTTAGK